MMAPVAGASGNERDFERLRRRMREVKYQIAPYGFGPQRGPGEPARTEPNPAPAERAPERAPETPAPFNSGLR